VADASLTLDWTASASGTLTSIASNVKVLVLFTPTVAYTSGELDVLKQFVRDGGQLVLVGEAQACCSDVIAPVNDVLAAFGSGMTHDEGSHDSGFTVLPATSLRAHPFTADMTSFVWAWGGGLVLGDGDVPLIYNSGNTVPFAAVANVSGLAPFPGLAPAAAVDPDDEARSSGRRWY
jgi:hypothetical protein